MVTNPASLARDLATLGDLKVWSVLVTLLGDLALNKGRDISGPDLTAIMARIGIKPDTIRVALHRLRKDGWIKISKTGRISRYSLSAHGKRETKAVQAQVYGLKAPQSDWHLIITAGDQPPTDAIAIRRGVCLSPAPSRQPDVISAPLCTPLPDWALHTIMPPDITTAYATLARILSHHVPDTLTHPTDQHAARILVLHNWRRIVLRHAPQAPDLMPHDWSGAECRSEVLRWLDILSAAACMPTKTT